MHQGQRWCLAFVTFSGLPDHITNASAKRIALGNFVNLCTNFAQILTILHTFFPLLSTLVYQGHPCCLSFVSHVGPPDGIGQWLLPPWLIQNFDINLVENFILTIVYILAVPYVHQWLEDTVSILCMGISIGIFRKFSSKKTGKSQYMHFRNVYRAYFYPIYCLSASAFHPVLQPTHYSFSLFKLN